MTIHLWQHQKRNHSVWMKKSEATMQRTLHAILILLLVSVGLAKPCTAEKDKVPVIEVDSTTYEFGQVSEGEVVTHDFKVFNRGDAVLEIKQVKPG